jgi:flavin reductase (DIM6/NTAB) family NADH-FMN oxidoreductase RutF
MISADEFRAIMRHWSAGVAILTSSDHGDSHGMTVTSFTSISAEPPLVSVSVAKSTRTIQRINQSGAFGVTILSKDQQWIAERFAGKDAGLLNRFDNIDTFTLTSGAPLISDGMAFFDCAVIYQYEMDHSILFIAQVNAVKHGEEKKPLIYLNRQYGTIDIK